MRIAAFCLGLLALASAGPAGAYTLMKDSQGSTLSPGKARTFSMSVGSSQFSSVGYGTTSWNDLFESAMNSWNVIGVGGGRDTGFFTKWTDGRYSNPCVGTDDDINVAVWDSQYCGKAWPTGVLAITPTFWFSPSATFKASVIFNTNFQWNAYPGALRSAGGGQTLQDFFRVAVHELGHSQGLSHPDEAGQSVTAVMNSHASATDRQVTDDINGTHAINWYPFGPVTNTYPLTVTVNGSGSVSSSPFGISCPGTCSTTVNAGSSVTLYASAGSGYLFSGWGGACNGSAGCTVTVNSATSVTANFTPGQSSTSYNLSVTVAGGGVVTSNPTGIVCTSSTCTGSFPAGTQVALTAAPASGNTFSGWSGSCTGTGGCTVAMSSDKSVTAVFAQPPKSNYTLTVYVTGSGRVTSNPAGIDCQSGTCAATFARDTTVTLTASPSTGYFFGGWGSSCSGNGGCSLRMNTDYTVGAGFSSTGGPTFPLTVSVGAGGTVTSSPAGINCPAACSANFSQSGTVTLTATPASGYQLSSWGGSCSGSGACSVFMDQAKAVTASFAAGSSTITPQTGYWWNPSEGGRGYMLEKNGNNVFFAAYLYNDTGPPIWYAAGPAPMNGKTFTASLDYYVGGQTLTGTWHASAVGGSAGTVSITFTDNSHATMTWPGGTLPIERFNIVAGGAAAAPQPGYPEAGYWWNTAEGGRGYGIEVQGGVLFLASYMYVPNGNTVWYAALNAMSSPAQFSSNWVQYKNGAPLRGNYRAAAIDNDNVGPATIQFTSPTSGTLTLPDGRQITIQRFRF